MFRCGARRCSGTCPTSPRFSGSPSREWFEPTGLDRLGRVVDERRRPDLRGIRCGRYRAEARLGGNGSRAFRCRDARLRSGRFSSASSSSRGVAAVIAGGDGKAACGNPAVCGASRVRVRVREGVFRRMEGVFESGVGRRWIVKVDIRGCPVLLEIKPALLELVTTNIPCGGR